MEDVMGDSGRKVVVVGGGLGGASAAISLASEGFSVTLLEKNGHLGGKLNLLEKEGFKFDLGPSLLIMPQVFEALFARVGKKFSDYVAIQPVEPQWRCLYEDGTALDLWGDAQQMEAELARFGPDVVKDYFDYVAYSRRQYGYCDDTYFAKGAETLRQILPMRSLLDHIRYSEAPRSMEQVIRRFVKEPHVKMMLEFLIKYVGSSAYQAPAILNMLLHSQIGFGAWYVTGGMINLGRGLHRFATELGVDVRLNTEVVRINKNPQRVESVVLEDGTVLEADLVVSNMEAIPAYEKLLGEGPRFMRQLERFEPACSGLVVHLGLDKHFPQLGHHTIWFSGDQKKHFNTVFGKYQIPEDPTIYSVVPTRTDPTLAPPGCEIIKLLPHIPHLQDRPFTQDQYDGLKERLYDKLERMGARDLRKHIVVEDVLTPHDIERMYYSNRGAIYGVVSDRFKNLGFKAPRKSTRYNNLYFVGGSVNPGGGMPMVTLSGQLVRDQILADFGRP
jgi:diapolycopene oxygenase